MTIHDQSMTICIIVDICQRISYNVCIMIPSSTTNQEYKMLQDKIFATMQAIVNSKYYPYLLGAFMAFVFAYLIYRGI